MKELLFLHQFMQDLASLNPFVAVAVIVLVIALVICAAIFAILKF